MKAVISGIALTTDGEYPLVWENDNGLVRIYFKVNEEFIEIGAVDCYSLLQIAVEFNDEKATQN